MQKSKEMESRSRLIAERVTDSVRILDHDPSLALYRLQEHVSRSLPGLVQRKITLNQVNHQLSGITFDLDNALSTVDNIKRSSGSFERSHELLRNCMYFKQHIDYESVRQGTGEMGQKGRSKSFHGHPDKK